MAKDSNTTRWRWVWDLERRDRLHDVGINEDGSLHNPHGYPEDLVRAAVAAAVARRHQRRSLSATQAAATRARRTALRVQQIAQRLVEGAGIGPNHHCQICRKAVTDADSIARGIGSECWQGVLAAVARRRASIANKEATR
jgi:hypothetical protein